MVEKRLKAMRAYLCGAMDRAHDGGVGWRREATVWLRSRGVIVLDPTNKPIDIGVEDVECRATRRERKLAGDFDGVARDMRVIRSVDLRMVDLCDFVVVNIDTEVHATGTYEELFWANRMKHPILVHVEQGKEHAPDWLLGTLPHQMIFSDWSELYAYLDYIDTSPQVDTLRRWFFFTYDVPPTAL